MKTWYIKDKDNVELVESTLDSNSNEVKVKISKVAILYSNLSQFANGQSSVHIPGHSAIANISEENEELGLKLGARVIVDPFLRVNTGTGTIIKTRGVDVDGLLQDFMTISMEDVFALPDGIKDNSAIFADYIAMGIKAFAEMDCNKGDYVVISGASTLGLIMCQLAQYYQLVPILVDFDKSRLELVSSWGIPYIVNPTFDNVDSKVQKITAGRMADVVIITGEALDSDAILRLVKEEGKLFVVGYSGYNVSGLSANVILRKQLQVRGICNGDGEISSAINLLANNIIKTDGIVNLEYNFDDVPKILKECAKHPQNNQEILISIE